MILKQFNILSIPTVQKSLKTIIKLGKDVTEKCQETNVVHRFNCNLIYSKIKSSGREFSFTHQFN